MTFRERWIQEHPSGNVNDVVITRCPTNITCAQCWDRETPEEQASATNEPKIKDITYAKVPMERDDVIGEATETIWEMIRKSQNEAVKRGIEANAVLINKNMVHVPTDFLHFPDMICGLEVYFTSTELPDNYSFAVLHSGNTKSERLARFESIGMEPEELKKAADMYRSIKEKLCDGSTDI